MSTSIFSDEAEKKFEAVPRQFCEVFKRHAKPHNVKVSCKAITRGGGNWIDVTVRAHEHSWAASSAKLGAALDGARNDPGFGEAWRKQIFGR